MGHVYEGGLAWATITHEMREAVRRHGADAIVRLREFGLQDRREAALKTLLAGAAPLAGMLLLGWEPLSAVASLLINVLLLEFEDIWKFLRAARPWDEVKRECVADQFVWPVATQMALGTRKVYGKTLPTVEQVEEGYVDTSWWVSLGFAVPIVGFVLFMLQGPGSVYGQGREVAFGSLPNVLAGIAISVFHVSRHHPHASRAASVRLASVLANSVLILALALCSFLAVSTPHGPGEDGEGLAVLSCLAVLSYGLYRLQRVGRLSRTAKWLERWIARTGSAQASQRSVLPVA